MLIYKQEFPLSWRIMNVKGDGIMNNEIFEYGLKLKIIGDWIENISKKSPEILNNIQYSKEALKIILYINTLSASEYEQCRLTMADIIAPDVILKEHQELIKALQHFIDGTQIMNQSIDIYNGKFDLFKYIEGLKLQSVGTEQVKKVMEKIVKKLGL